MTEGNNPSLISLISRRSFVQGGLCAAAGLFFINTGIANAAVSKSHRTLSFFNTHTGEKLRATYWENGRYVPEALTSINNVLRDFRTNDVFPIDRKLLDVLAVLHQRTGSGKPFDVISGYRSPKTNAALHSRSNGVASRSLHMDGKAIDIRLSDTTLSKLRTTAIDMQQGGVGYYASSNFVHVDVGRVRKW